MNRRGESWTHQSRCGNLRGSMTVLMPPAAAMGDASVDARAARADAMLDATAAIWLVTALIGQWTFLYYIAVFYDAATLRGDFAAWSRNTYLLKGYVAGDFAGNLAFAAHVLIAAIVTFAGALQLVPQIRARVIGVHRWNGRLFLLASMTAAASGLYMVWVRGSRANIIAGLATSLDAILILAFAVMAWRAVRARRIDAHRRWALRTWIAASGIWFQRIGIFGWTTFHHAPVGMTNRFDGWFDLSWAFGCYLLPLAILEAYLRVRERHGERGRYLMAAGMLLLAVVTAYATHAAYANVWRPFLWRLGA